jgi:hypothetical protein
MAEQSGPQFGQEVRFVISVPADHDTVDVLEMGQYLIGTGDAAVQYDRQIREFPFEFIHTIVVQWRDTAVVLWTEALQDRNSRVDDERIAAGRSQCRDKIP